MKANPPNALLRNVLNNYRLGGLCAVTSGQPQDILTVVPEKPSRDVTRITKSL
jgi:hypothetical protein